MKTQWLHREKNDSLMLFCSGWGMDYHPFSPLLSKEYDVLICFDYTAETAVPDVRKLSVNYSRIILVAWSMGVAYAQRFFTETQKLFQHRIAINGTLCPIHNTFGIPINTFNATLTNISEESMLNFYHRMCRSPQLLTEFLKNSPARTVKSQKEELQAIYSNIGCLDEEKSIYTDVIISKKDFIIPTVNQLHFWKSTKVSTISGYHFPFYQWKSWDELVKSTVV